MKIIPFAAAVMLFFSALPAMAKGGSHSVRGYTKKDSTYVQPHHATNRDNTKSNNYSHKGNVNPYTGKEGTRND
ncbi:hypothetical protein D8B23_17170 [Verminephrobacter aporrectodeae subsp. tuberculatae]|uniref:Uncharacterized protein n=1 Tax=Verminephrobacter aporrectodeae subsp. tuberculatae TaxID=1110392 RepID=A0ABT3KUM0_9BURK|nr:hypothetical protein [Verminephrobacter aporrectodeae]MCW5322013.1 hypothetical protein [Verminephrobacter aporrectodeae subsp. tuberculatae]MCW8200092.1 hypothetical protein [Verminephrobacter aporrectodeae subsp. tuberculatae]